MTDTAAPQLTPAMCELADSQFGMITRTQAEDAGVADLPAALVAAALAEKVTDTVIRLRAGAHHPHPLIYAAWLDVDATSTSVDIGHQLDAIASHSTALVLYDLIPPTSPILEFTAWEPEPELPWDEEDPDAGPRPRLCDPDQPRLYWRARLPQWETVAGIPTTTPAQSLYDLADRLTTAQLHELARGFVDHHRTDPDRLHRDLLGLARADGWEGDDAPGSESLHLADWAAAVVKGR